VTDLRDYVTRRLIDVHRRARERARTITFAGFGSTLLQALFLPTYDPSRYQLGAAAGLVFLIITIAASLRAIHHDQQVGFLATQLRTDL